jgi:hypothetical protein
MCEHEIREHAMVVLRRNEEGQPTVWCDPCIAPLVEALQPFGTVWSCCGHGEETPSVIGLDDGRQVIVVSNLEEAMMVLDIFPSDRSQPPRRRVGPSKRTNFDRQETDHVPHRPSLSE